MNTNKYLNSLQNKLTGFEWGIKKGKDISYDFSDYKTVSPTKFIRDKCGVCWDYCNYISQNLQRKGFKNTTKKLTKDKTYSLMYMESSDKPEVPTHTWVIVRDGGQIYSFESSWKPHAGYTPWGSEDQCVRQYKQWFRESEGVTNIHVFKYRDTATYGQDPMQFMMSAKTTGSRFKTR